jgi:hypothetical protein
MQVPAQQGMPMHDCPGPAQLAASAAVDARMEATIGKLIAAEDLYRRSYGNPHSTSCLSRLKGSSTVWMKRACRDVAMRSIA